MNKEEFLSALKDSLKGLSQEDVAERVAFYSEAIDDRVEEGLAEEEAVAQLGTADAIASQILRDIPCTRPEKKKRRLGALEIVLLVFGSPIWLSLLVAAFVVVISLYVVLWSVVISVWTVPVSLFASSAGCLVGAGILFFTGNIYGGLVAVSFSFFCAGLSIFGLYGFKALTKLAAKLTKKSVLWLVRLFIRKEDAK